MNTILLNDNFQPNRITNRLEICQKIYTTEFLGQKFYTLKVRKFWLFLLKKETAQMHYALTSVIQLEFN